MNINEIWNTFESIYVKAAPVVFISFLALSSFIWSLRLPIKSKLSKAVRLCNTKNARILAKFLKDYKLSILAPAVFTILTFAFLVLVSAFFDNTADKIPIHQVSLPNGLEKELVLQHQPAEDLAIILSTDSLGIAIQKSNMDSLVYQKYLSEVFRLRGKHALRYKPVDDQLRLYVAKYHARYGGTLIFATSVIFTMFLIVCHKINDVLFKKYPNIYTCRFPIWISALRKRMANYFIPKWIITLLKNLRDGLFGRTIFCLLFSFWLCFYCRDQWKRAFEDYVKTQIQVTVILLQQEEAVKLNPSYVSKLALKNSN